MLLMQEFPPTAMNSLPATKPTLINVYIETIEKSERVYEAFNEGLWQTIVQKATVHSDGRLVFTFSNGQEIEG